jgi:hypothetical protein
MFTNNPYAYTSDEALYEVNGTRRELGKKEFFSKGQPSLRFIALSKRYGWGVHCNAEGKVAIYAVQSPEYKNLSSDKALRQLKAVRSHKKQEHSE